MLFVVVAIAYAQVQPSGIGATVCNGAFCSGPGTCTDGSTCFNGRCLQAADLPFSTVGGYCGANGFQCAAASANPPAVTLSCANNRCSAAIGQPIKGVGCPCRNAGDCVSSLCNATSSALTASDNLQGVQTFCLASGLKNGASCAHNSQCASQICTSGACTAIPNGGPCILNVASLSFAPNVQLITNPCLPNSYCVPAGGTNAQTCQPYVSTAGGTCSAPSAGTYILCQPPMYCNTGSSTTNTGTCAAPGSVTGNGACGVGASTNPPTIFSPSTFCASGYCGSAGNTANHDQCISPGSGIATGSSCASLYYGPVSGSSTANPIMAGWDRFCASGACDKMNALGGTQANCMVANTLPYQFACAGNWDTAVCGPGMFCSREASGTTFACRKGSYRGSGAGGYCYNDDGCSGSDMKCVDNSCTLPYTGRACGGAADCLSQYGASFVPTTLTDQNGFGISQPTLAPTFTNSYLTCECTKGGSITGSQCVTATAPACFAQKQAFVSSLAGDYYPSANNYFYPFQPYSTSLTFTNPATQQPWTDPTNQAYTAQLMVAIAFTGSASQKSALVAYLCCTSCAAGSPGLDGSVNANSYANAFGNRNSYIIRAMPGPLNCGSNSFGTWGSDDAVSRCSYQNPDIPYANAVQCSSAFDVAPKVVVILAATLLAVVLMLAH